MRWAPTRRAGVNALLGIARFICQRIKVRSHVRSCDREVSLFYYVQIAIGDFYYAQLCAKLCVCARAIRSALRRNRSKSDLRFQLRANAD